MFIFNSFNALGEVVGPQRVVSSSLASDEILVELLAPQGIKRIVAVSARADLATESNVRDLVKGIPHRFGGEAEAITSWKPDLVLAAAYNRPELLALLRHLKIPVVVLDRFDNFDAISENIRIISQALKMDAAGRDMNRRFREALAKEEKRFKLSADSRRPSVLIYADPTTVMAKETMADAVVTAAGLRNLASEAGLKRWPTVDPERLTKWQPDFVVFAGEKSEAQRTLSKALGWNMQKAVKEGRIIAVPQRLLGCISPHVVEAITAIGNQVYKSP